MYINDLLKEKKNSCSTLTNIADGRDIMTKEIIEFLEVYFSPTYILIILCTVLFITASYYILKRKLTELKKRAFYSTIAGIISSPSPIMICILLLVCQLKIVS